jgi:hypothetical protein
MLTALKTCRDWRWLRWRIDLATHIRPVRWVIERKGSLQFSLGPIVRHTRNTLSWINGRRFAGGCRGASGADERLAGSLAFTGSRWIRCCRRYFRRGIGGRFPSLGRRLIRLRPSFMRCSNRTSRITRSNCIARSTQTLLNRFLDSPCCKIFRRDAPPQRALLMCRRSHSAFPLPSMGRHRLGARSCSRNRTDANLQSNHTRTVSRCLCG